MKATDRKQAQKLWQQRLTDWQQSGLTQAEWCRQHQQNCHQLGYWKRKFLDKPDSKLIPLTVITPEPDSPALLIHVNSIRIEATPEQAARLIKALQAS